MYHGNRCIVVLVLIGILAGCTRIPYDCPRAASHALGDPGETRLARVYQDQLRAGPGQSGFMVLDSGPMALASRLMLIDAAEKTLDVQYYIFANDHCGMLIAEHLCAAADRGVRVRLLVDDWEHPGLDGYFAAIAAHENIEVRVFNPIDGVRDWPVSRPVAYLVGPDRLRQHMHNKALIADNAMAVIGGRNVADEYFGAGSERNFGDMDLLAIGPLTRDISRMFDLFWNYALSIPIEAWQRIPSVARQKAMRESLAANAREVRDTQLHQSIRQLDVAGALERRTLPLVWSTGEFLFDHPDKTRFTIEQEPSFYMVRQLRDLLARTESQTLIISPYFVPGAEGMEVLRELRQRGVGVKALTNSLASNDVRPSHVAYRKYRRDMLAMGVELFELRPDPSHPRSALTWMVNSVPVLGSVGPLAGESAVSASLHAKTMILDDKTVFVGSFNLDPRSMRLDTQNGIVVHSAELARQLTGFFDRHTTPSHAYRVVFRDGSSAPWWQRDSRALWWICEKDGQEYRYDDEPLIDPWDRFWVWFVAGMIPEEWM